MRDWPPRDTPDDSTMRAERRPRQVRRHVMLKLIGCPS